MKKAVILLSGGLDSATCLALATSQGFRCHALSFDYGQRHSIELEAAKRVAAHCKVAEHRILRLDLGQLGGSALTQHALDVPEFAPGEAIPITYVPARNTVFLSMALAYAEVIEAEAIFIGVSAVDYSNYPDCRPAFIEAFEKLATLATKAGVEGNPLHIHTPLLHLSKAQTIEAGLRHGMDYGLTVSCYQATETQKRCGHCPSCSLREQGFVQAGLIDPIGMAK